MKIGNIIFRQLFLVLLVIIVSGEDLACYGSSIQNVLCLSPDTSPRCDDVPPSSYIRDYRLSFSEDRKYTFLLRNIPSTPSKMEINVFDYSISKENLCSFEMDTWTPKSRLTVSYLNDKYIIHGYSGDYVMIWMTHEPEKMCESINQEISLGIGIEEECRPMCASHIPHGTFHDDNFQVREMSTSMFHEDDFNTWYFTSLLHLYDNAGTSRFCFCSLSFDASSQNVQSNISLIVPEDFLENCAYAPGPDTLKMGSSLIEDSNSIWWSISFMCDQPADPLDKPGMRYFPMQYIDISDRSNMELKTTTHFPINPTEKIYWSPTSSSFLVFGVYTTGGPPSMYELQFNYAVALHDTVTGELKCSTEFRTFELSSHVLTNVDYIPNIDTFVLFFQDLGIWGVRFDEVDENQECALKEYRLAGDRNLFPDDNKPPVHISFGNLNYYSEHQPFFDTIISIGDVTTRHGDDYSMGFVLHNHFLFDYPPSTPLHQYNDCGLFDTCFGHSRFIDIDSVFQPREDFPCGGLIRFDEIYQFGFCVSPDECLCFGGSEEESLYSGKRCHNYTCYDIPWYESRVCGGRGKCLRHDKCWCREGFHGPECSQFDACLNKTCNLRGECIEGVCMCDPGFYGVDCQDEFTGLCNQTFFGKHKSEICHGHGECGGVTLEGEQCTEQYCECFLGYEKFSHCKNKLNCSGEIYPDLNSDLQWCTNHGKCLRLSGDDVCSCWDDFQGVECEESRTCNGLPFYDFDRTCGGNGFCFAQDFCLCNPSFEGENCEIEKKCNGVLASYNWVCSGRGTCEEDEAEMNSFVCSCDPDYEGENCEVHTGDNILCDGKKPDDPLTCSTHGDCMGPDICQCTSESYFGTFCNAWRCDGVMSNNSKIVCSGHGECVDSDICECQEGYSTPGRYCQDFSCFSVDRSDKEVCSGHGTCIEYDQCDCIGDYFGAQCQSENSQEEDHKKEEEEEESSNSVLVGIGIAVAVVVVVVIVLVVLIGIVVVVIVLYVYYRKKKKYSLLEDEDDGVLDLEMKSLSDLEEEEEEEMESDFD